MHKTFSGVKEGVVNYALEITRISRYSYFGFLYAIPEGCADRVVTHPLTVKMSRQVSNLTTPDSNTQ